MQTSCKSLIFIAGENDFESRMKPGRLIVKLRSADALSVPLESW
jgi:hypothetical protein